MKTGERGAKQESRRSRECREAQQRLVFIEELSGEEAAAVRAHLGLCPDCGHIERLFRGLLAAIRDMPAAEDAYWDRMAGAIMARIRAAPLPWWDQSSGVE
jgi:hypothetical protein